MAKVPGEGAYGSEENSLITELEQRISQYTTLMEEAEFRKAMVELRAIWVAGNEYLTRAAPWTHIKTDRAKAAVGVRMGLNLVHLFAHLSWPVMPVMARKIHESIQPTGDGDIIPWPDDMPLAEELDDLEHGITIGTSDVLFAKRHRRAGCRVEAAIWRRASWTRSARREPLPAILAESLKRQRSRLVVHFLATAPPLAEIDVSKVRSARRTHMIEAHRGAEAARLFARMEKAVDPGETIAQPIRECATGRAYRLHGDIRRCECVPASPRPWRHSRTGPCPTYRRPNGASRDRCVAALNCSRVASAGT